MDERNPAGRATLKLEYGILMLLAGRHEKAEEAFDIALDLLKKLEVQLDEGTYPRPIHDETQHSPSAESARQRSQTTNR